MLVDDWGVLKDLGLCSDIHFIKVRGKTVSAGSSSDLSNQIYGSSFTILKNLRVIRLRIKDCSVREYFLEIRYSWGYKALSTYTVQLGEIIPNHGVAVMFFKTLTSQDIAINSSGISILKRIQWSKTDCLPSIQINYYPNKSLTKALANTEEFLFFPFNVQFGHCIIYEGKNLIYDLS